MKIMKLSNSWCCKKFFVYMLLLQDYKMFLKFGCLLYTYLCVSLFQKRPRAIKSVEVFSDLLIIVILSCADYFYVVLKS